MDLKIEDNDIKALDQMHSVIIKQVDLVLDAIWQKLYSTIGLDRSLATFHELAQNGVSRLVLSFLRLGLVQLLLQRLSL